MTYDILAHIVQKHEPPRIVDTYREFEGVNDPDRIRWRATWHRHWDTGLPVGIELTPYPVARKTTCGAWVDPLAYYARTYGDAQHEWKLSDKGLWKFVHDGSGSAWAKPTRAEALRSLGIRLTRWIAKVRRDVARVNAACDVAEALLSCESFATRSGHEMFWPGYEARRHKIRLADDAG